MPLPNFIIEFPHICRVSGVLTHQVDLRAFVIFAAVDEPLDDADDDYDEEGNDAVIWKDGDVSEVDCRV